MAYASSDGFNFGEGLDTFDEKKAEVRGQLEELEEELADVETQIREVGAGQVAYRPGALTGRISSKRCVNANF